MKNVKRALVFDEPLMSLQDVRAFVVRDRLSPNWVLADGTEMSVQFHEGAYCEPRGLSVRDRFKQNLRIQEVEVGFPSKRIEALTPYAEEPDKPTDTVYGYVPEIVMTYIIEQCGGIVRVESVDEIEVMK